MLQLPLGMGNQPQCRDSVLLASLPPNPCVTYWPYFVAWSPVVMCPFRAMLVCWQNLQQLWMLAWCMSCWQAGQEAGALLIKEGFISQGGCA